MDSVRQEVQNVSQTSTNSLTVLNIRNQKCVERYRSIFGNADLKLVFPATAQSTITADVCFNTNYCPTLYDAVLSTTEGKVKAWLVVQVGYFVEMAGPDKALSDAQVLDIANMILSDYLYLTFKEVLFFFKRLKLGHYGRFYGSMDSMVIMGALKSYADDVRAKKMELEGEELRKRQEESAKKGITYKEYIELKKRAQSGDMAAQELLKFE